MKYKDWNDLIAAHFFHRDMAGKNVYLYVTQELISDLGQDKGKGFVDFIDAVKTGFRLKQKSEGICKDALWSMRQKIGLYPSYIGYLALFVLAAGIEGDFDPKSYYPRLRKLFKSFIFGFVSFKKSYDLNLVCLKPLLHESQITSWIFGSITMDRVHLIRYGYQKY